VPPKIHPTALVDPAATLADDVEVGPYCIVGPGVELGPGCRLLGRVSVRGPLRAGKNNVFHYNSAVGGDPQDAQPAGAGARVEIGDDNVFRESVTVHHPKTPGGTTRVGSRNRFHATSHVSHDSVIGDGVVIATSAIMGGHCRLEDGSWLEGQGGIHQFVTVGRMSVMKAQSGASEDIPPFMVVEGNHYVVRGVNPRCRSEALQRAFETVWKSGLPRLEAIETLEREEDPQVRELAAFLRRSRAGRNGRALEGQRK
jgi:UDP-N-acetylglucosamine acyltransferase